MRLVVYPCSRTIRWTSSRVSGETSSRPFITRETVAIYEQTVLRALEETENALVAYREQQRRLVSLVDQARESGRAAAIARVRYREGLADFLALLDAERTELQAEDSVAQAEAGVFSAVVAVYKAFGGIV